MEEIQWVLNCPSCTPGIINAPPAWWDLLSKLKKKNNFIYLFYFWLCWVFNAACGLSLCSVCLGYSWLQCRLLIVVASLVAETGLEGIQASVVAAHGLSSCVSWAREHRLSSYGTQGQLLCSIWDLPEPGIEPVSPELAGRFLPLIYQGIPWVFKFEEFFFEEFSSSEETRRICNWWQVLTQNKSSGEQ